ncbi:MAG: rRNA maturation RNase YbeY [gamma proteobacterium symbiont of Taylorina sp.]|nr:rRNA maturation RNase YbeY [gamma proteobacterium symbiont of Taylorina sp.]
MIDSVSIPDKDRIESWVKAALMADTAHNKQPGQDEQELTIRIVGKDEIRNLNKTYRHQDKTTNVLSFPFEAPSQVQLPLLGDIVICHDIVAEEAEQQQKTLFSHWAHMVIHGVLHLKGYDHIEDSEAEIMEALEIKIMEQSGFANPYYEP